MRPEAPAPVTCRNLVGGRWEDAASGRTRSNRCPADDRVELGTAPDSGAEDARRAVAAAREAFPAWARTPAPRRGDLVFRFAHLLEQRAEEVARALSWEEGKVLAEARGELQKTLKYLRFAAGDARRLAGITVPSEVPGTFAFTTWRPRGVVGLVTPWNFPVAIPAWKMAPALVAGNTVVLKPAPETPWTAHLLAELAVEAGFPDGVVNVVHGDAEPARALLEHPDVAAISFTGSTEVGRIVERACGEAHKAVQCELGGKNPMIVLADADLDLAADATAMGAFGSTGQRCTATSRAIVHESVADAFVERLLARARAVRPGHPLDPEATMGPAVSERQLRRVLSFHEVARADGARPVLVGGRLEGDGLEHGWFVGPSIYDHVRPDARVATEEIFGPFLCVLRFSTLDQAIEMANAVRYGLTGSVFTRDLGTAFQVIERLDAGMTQVNNPTVGGEGHLPFGGIKATGVGPREMGPDAWRFYAEPKTVYLNHAGAARTGRFY